MPGLLARAKSCLQLSETDQVELEPTALYLKGQDEHEEPERLYLPRRGSAPCLHVDEYLSRIPRVISRAQELQAYCAVAEASENDDDAVPQRQTSPKPLLKASSSRCLNVLQGEVAHASALQADVVVSAEATTCHVVALRSTTSGDSAPLVSLAHVDKAGVYDSCLDAMVQEHIRHHQKTDEANHNEQDSDDDFFFFDQESEPTRTQHAASSQHTHEEEEEKPSFLPGLGFGAKSASMPCLAATTKPNELIDMELHMVGGFLDEEGTSQTLSTSLITTFSQLADKYQDKLCMSLSTAAISCMNTTTEQANSQDGTTCPAPKSRGMGIDVGTGEVFAVQTALPAHLEGPALEIRSARAWARAAALQRASRTGAPVPKEALHVIHDTTSHEGQVRVAPFHYEPLQNLNALLHVPDDVLLQYTSTSPECESDRFCSDIRRTLSFLNTVPAETVFGQDCSNPLVYSRSMGNLNEWEEVTVHAQQAKG